MQKAITLYIEPELLAWVDEMVKPLDCSRNELLNKIVTQYRYESDNNVPSPQNLLVEISRLKAALDVALNPPLADVPLPHSPWITWESLKQTSPVLFDQLRKVRKC